MESGVIIILFSAAQPDVIWITSLTLSPAPAVLACVRLCPMSPPSQHNQFLMGQKGFVTQARPLLAYDFLHLLPKSFANVFPCLLSSQVRAGMRGRGTGERQEASSDQHGIHSREAGLQPDSSCRRISVLAALPAPSGCTACTAPRLLARLALRAADLL